MISYHVRVYFILDKYNVACIADDLGKNYELNLDDLYVNASFIDGPLSEDYKFFIATQGPLNNTISKFWKLIFYQDVKLIVMLCRLEEDLRVK